MRSSGPCGKKFPVQSCVAARTAAYLGRSAAKIMSVFVGFVLRPKGPDIHPARALRPGFQVIHNESSGVQGRPFEASPGLAAPLGLRDRLTGWSPGPRRPWLGERRARWA